MPQMQVRSNKQIAAGIASSLLASDVGRLNLLANGGFETWQRGAGPFTGSPGGRVYTADRWTLVGGVSSTTSISRDSANAAPGSAYCAALTCTGTCDVRQEVGGIAGSESIVVESRGKTLTFSARVKTTVANGIRIQVSDGVVGTSSAFHSGSGGYETLSVTAPVAPNGSILSVYFIVSATGTFYLDNAMLTFGSAADYFPIVPADDLLRCLRYFEVIAPAAGLYWALGYGAAAGSQVLWPYSITPKAVLPTVTKLGNWTLINATGMSLNNVSKNTVSVYVTATAAGGTGTYPADATGTFTLESNP